VQHCHNRGQVREGNLPAKDLKMNPAQLLLRVRKPALVFLGLAAAFIVGALGSPVSAQKDAPGVTSDTIKLGSCNALSGPASFLGMQMVIGAKAYFSLVNEQGGVHGRKIELETKDDGYEADRAASCWESLEKAGVFATAFFVGTPTGLKYIPLADASHTPLIGLFTGAQALIDPVHRTIFNIRASYFDETREQVDGLWDQLGIHKIAVLYQNDPFGTTVLEGVKKALARHHSTPVALGTFERNTLDVDQGIKDVRGSEPEAVVLVGPYAPVNAILKRAHAAGWHPRFLTVSFVGTEGLLRIGAQDAEGMIITQVVPPYDRTDLPTVKLYREALEKHMGNTQPSFVSLEGFVDAMVVVDGLRAAGRDLTREKLVAALEAIHHKDIGLGPNLLLGFSATDHKGLDSVYVTVIKSGQAVAVSDWKQLAKR
jgi:branched-chain amino acid transport system substrate-binding protein